MDSFNDVWKEVLNYLHGKLSDVVCNIWLDPLEPIKLENDTAVLMTNSDFKKNVVEEKFHNSLCEAFEVICGFPVAVDILVSQPIPEKQNNDSSPMEEYTFDNFIVGSSNKFAYSASMRVANAPGYEFNPLLIYGRSGMGKTHLMLAIYNEMQKRYKNSAIIYTTGEDFTNELIHHIAEKSTAAFHQKYRNVDALLVDDIQFIRSRVSTQEEFFHTFNALTQAGKQIVLTSDRPPKEMETLDERLRTRFEMGLLADIQPPDIDTRIAIIKRKANLCDLELSPSVIEILASGVKSNIRQIEGCVKKLAALKKIEGIYPSVEVAHNIVSEVMTYSKPVSETVASIIEAVASEFRVSVADIKSEKRNASISTARQVSMYIIRELTSMPLQNIGDYFGGKNHATVHHAIKQVEQKMMTDSSLKVTVADLCKSLEEGE